MSLPIKTAFATLILSGSLCAFLLQGWSTQYSFAKSVKEESNETTSYKKNKFEKPPSNIIELNYEPNPIMSHSSPMKAEVTGNSCKNLRVKITPINGDKSVYEGDMYCLPDVESILDWFSNERVAYIDRNKIAFDRGPILLAMRDFGQDREKFLNIYLRNDLNIPKESHDRIISHIKNIPQTAKLIGSKFYLVKDIAPCNHHHTELLCAETDVYSVERKTSKLFKIYCWDCDLLSAGRDELQAAMLFEMSGYGILLNGGIAFEFDSIAANWIPKIKKLTNK